MLIILHLIRFLNDFYTEKLNKIADIKDCLHSKKPEENRNFKSDFDYKNKFRANFIETNATEIGANETKSNEIKVLVAAKEVRVIDNYAENLKI